MTQQTISHWHLVTTEPDGLSESPFWHPHEQRLYWVDIPGRRLARVQVQHLTQPLGEVEYWPVPEEPGCMAPVVGGGVIVALRDGIYLGRTWGGPLELLAAVMVPSFLKAGLSVGIFSSLTLPGPSSTEITVSPERSLTVTGVISAANAPDLIAACARCTLAVAKLSCCSRVKLYLAAQSSPKVPIERPGW